MLTQKSVIRPFSGKIGRALGAAAIGGTVALMMASPVSALEREVTSQRLLNAANEPENWLTVHGSYSSTRYSKLAQINRDNVSNLKFAFAVALGGLQKNGLGLPGGLQTTPLVNDGYMYVANGWSETYKIDVRSGRKGEILWIMDPGIDPAEMFFANNRGVGLYKDKVITATIDGRVMASDRDSGEVVWETVTRSATGEGHSGAPLVVKDKVLVGQSAGDWGTRGWLAALSGDTGKMLWKTYSVPNPGDPGSETWQDGHDAYKTGGGAMWVTGSYDPETNLTIWGTGNPVPMFDPQFRPGDNLYTDSTVAFDLDTGKIAWYFQYTPGDYLDYDEVGSQMLVDVNIGGDMRKTVAHFGRNGFWYTLDRNNGSFITGSQYLDQVTWTKGIDPKTGKPLGYDSSKALQQYIAGVAPRRGEPKIHACPHLQGGVNFWPAAYNPDTGIAYGAAFEGCFAVQPAGDQLENPNFNPEGNIWLGGDFSVPTRNTGSITGVNVSTGKVAVKANLPFPEYGGLLTTAGGLVFAGHLDGTFAAYDAETLAELWSVNTGTPFKAPPMTYAVNGKQYVAIAAGFMGGMAAPVGAPELDNYQDSNMLWVFSF